MAREGEPEAKIAIKETLDPPTSAVLFRHMYSVLVARRHILVRRYVLSHPGRESYGVEDQRTRRRGHTYE